MRSFMRDTEQVVRTPDEMLDVCSVVFELLCGTVSLMFGSWVNTVRHDCRLLLPSTRSNRLFHHCASAGTAHLPICCHLRAHFSYHCSSLQHNTQGLPRLCKPVLVCVCRSPSFTVLVAHIYFIFFQGLHREGDVIREKDGKVMKGHKLAEFTYKPRDLQVQTFQAPVSGDVLACKKVSSAAETFCTFAASGGQV